MIREFIRTEVVPYELTNQEKLSFILKNSSILLVLALNSSSDSEEV